ncbi:hypothetical protein PTTG_02748 [Puccinia triticina 1-1 BBBD Race 1]|uniref:Uncharacterized protein n=2 Tax=Puccinia triticina TaxID=208348 RepID=A0A0C4EPP5_PUCT1|nr:hypothetical protein PTTG_02748 [Puccinia triticina 1-1 BBBD Race 1]
MVGSLALVFLGLQVLSIVVNAASKSTETSTLHRNMDPRSPQGTTKPSGSNQKRPPSPDPRPSTTEGGTPINPPSNGKPVPFGFGSKVTGGGNAAPQTPRDTAELQAWLTDKVPRVILIRKTYDFTLPSRNITAPAYTIDNHCSTQVSLQASGLEPIKVASHKTLLGVGATAIIKGKG